MVGLGTSLPTYTTYTHRRLVTCGHDCDVRLFAGIEDDDCSEFSVSSDNISALACYQRNGKDLVAIATDDNTVQVYTSDVSFSGLGRRSISSLLTTWSEKAHLISTLHLHLMSLMS